MKKDARTRIVPIRFSKEEYEYITAKQKKTTLCKSEFLRRLIFENAEKIGSKEDFRMMNFMALSMGQANNNINQIARALNYILKAGEYNFRLGAEQQRLIAELQGIVTEWKEFSYKISQ